MSPPMPYPVHGISYPGCGYPVLVLARGWMGQVRVGAGGYPDPGQREQGRGGGTYPGPGQGTLPTWTDTHL